MTDKKDIEYVMIGIISDYSSREQLAAEQGEDFDEDLGLVLDEWVESLPEHERAFAWSLESSEKSL
jgi:hypothetical protein